MAQLFMLPLGQAESVDVVIHVLTTGADCSTCPAKKYCAPGVNVPCQSIGTKLKTMLAANQLPLIDFDEKGVPTSVVNQQEEQPPATDRLGKLRRVK